MAELAVAGVKSAKPGRHADGSGLYLLVKPTGARSWLLRIQVNGRRRDVGLGSVDFGSKRHDLDTDLTILHRKILTLAEAREKSDILKRAAKVGRDPVEARDRERSKAPTFEVAAKACQADLKASWGQRQQDGFLSSLERHALPALGKRRVDQIDAGDIRDMLARIWS